MPSLVGITPEGGAPRGNAAPAGTAADAVMRRTHAALGGRGQALGLFRPHQKGGPGTAGWLDLVALTPQMGHGGAIGGI